MKLRRNHAAIGGFHRRFHLSIIIVFFFMLVSSAQAGIPTIQWTRTFGLLDYDDAAYSVQQTSDGGYILTGGGAVCNSFAFIIKTDANGNEKWNKTFDGFSLYSVQQTSDGGYILGGCSLLKIDSNGNEEWSKTTDFIVKSVQQTSDGGYVFAGWGQNPNSDSTNWDARLIKTDMSGNLLWNRTFGGNSDDYVWSVERTSDGGYILAGNTVSYKDLAWLIKTDANGYEQWNNTFFGCKNAYSVQQTRDGGYILAGRSESLSDAMIVKTDPKGNELWKKTFSQKYLDQDIAYSVRQTGDGSYVLVGEVNDGTWKYAFMIKTDTSGNQQWSKNIGSAESSAYSIRSTSDGGYVVVGSKNEPGKLTDPWIIKISNDGSSTPTSPAQQSQPKTPGFEAILAGTCMILAFALLKR